MRFVDVSRVRSRFDEEVEARDGTRLSVDLYLPPESGRYPVLLTQTPYDNNRFSTFAGVPSFGDGAGSSSPAERFKHLAARGFAVVAADARGRGDSDGEFVPFADGAGDGGTLVEWARALPESNGRTGAFGSGYAGFMALRAGAEASLDALVVSSPMRPADIPARNDAVRLEWLFWMHLVAGRTPQPVDVPRWLEIFRHRPLVEMADALGRSDIWWAEWLRRGASPSSSPRVAIVPSAPTLFTTGWYDGAAAATIELWEAARRAHPDGDHRLLVGPWDPEAVRRPRAQTGGVEWGPAALVDPDELLIEWFSAHLMGGESPPGGPARIFLTGRNEWADRQTLRAEGESRRLWLDSGGAANTRRGDGRLTTAPAQGGADRFVHDPDNPVPWQPRFGTFSRSGGPRLMLETEFATGRDDVLVYDSEPFDAAILFAGAPVVRLNVETSARDADWMVGIADLFPGGRTVLLAHGAARMGSAAPATQLRIELDPIGHELLAGHRLRLMVCSSLFPLYAVNLGGEDYLGGVEAHRAEQSVLHSGTRQSWIELPVIDERHDVAKGSEERIRT